ncbi:uncharacterized protein LOC144448906 [Glandiceps talaboti]
MRIEKGIVACVTLALAGIVGVLWYRGKKSKTQTSEEDKGRQKQSEEIELEPSISDTMAVPVQTDDKTICLQPVSKETENEIIETISNKNICKSEIEDTALSLETKVSVQENFTEPKVCTEGVLAKSSMPVLDTEVKGQETVCGFDGAGRSGLDNTEVPTADAVVVEKVNAEDVEVESLCAQVKAVTCEQLNVTVEQEINQDYAKDTNLELQTKDSECKGEASPCVQILENIDLTKSAADDMVTATKEMSVDVQTGVADSGEIAKGDRVDAVDGVKTPKAEVSQDSGFTASNDSLPCGRSDTDSPIFSPYNGSSYGSEASSEAISDVSSNDSGRGSQSAIAMNTAIIYEFEFPTKYCGRLIGRGGRNIKYLRERSGAWIVLRKLPFDDAFQQCVITGLRTEVDAAIVLLGKKFPDIDLTRNTTPLDSNGAIAPTTKQLKLPEDAVTDVVVSSIVTTGHLFVQQPSHPSYTSLSRLDNFMVMCYAPPAETPDMPRPIDVGMICAVPLLEGWYRAQIVELIPDTDEVDVRFVDYGGYSRVQASTLKQIRSDFLSLPFQAAECYLRGITPLEGEVGFSQEARDVLEEITQSGVPLQAQVTSYHDDGIPFIELYQYNSEDGAQSRMVNEELFERGVVNWNADF